MIRLFSAWLTFVVVGIIGCGSSPKEGTTPSAETPVAADHEAPKLELSTPRDSQVPGRSIRIAGRVRDSSPVSVEVAGNETPVHGDGSFAQTVAARSGPGRFRIVATDQAGNRATDFVAFLAGPSQPTGSAVAGPMEVAVTPNVLSALLSPLRTELQSRDLEAELKARNPIAKGVWGQATLASLSTGRPELSVLPANGQWHIKITVPNIEAQLPVRLSLGGQTTATVRASRFELVAALSEPLLRRLATSRGNDAPVQATVHDFALNLSGMPSFVAGLVRGTVRKELERAIQTRAAATARSALGRLSQEMVRARSITLQGHTTALTPRLDRVMVSPDAIRLRFDVGLGATADGEKKERFRPVTQPTTVRYPTPDHRGIFIHLDLINAALHDGWNPAPVEVLREVPSMVVSSLLRDAPQGPMSLVAQLELPPQAYVADGQLWLGLPDVTVSLVSSDGATLLSISIGLDVAVELQTSPQQLKLAVKEVTAMADVLTGNARVQTGQALDALVGDLVKPHAQRIASKVAVDLAFLGPLGIRLSGPVAMSPTGISSALSPR